MKTGRKAFCCWSGGKESALSLYRAQQSGYNICCLLNMVSQDGNHSRTHGINSDWLKRQSESMGIPIIQPKTMWKNYETEFKKAVSELRENRGLKIGIFGDIDLKPHRDWVERVCRESDIEPILPLWGEEREKLLEEFISAGFKTIYLFLPTLTLPAVEAGILYLVRLRVARPTERGSLVPIRDSCALRIFLLAA